MMKLLHVRWFLLALIPAIVLIGCGQPEQGVSPEQAESGSPAVTESASVPVIGSVDTVGNAERGRELATDCAACHGADGNSPSPAFPILAGQHEQYLYEALKAYQARLRNNAIMSATIIGKTDQQLQDLAAWYASQKGLGGGRGKDSGVAAAATASGALLAEGGSDLTNAVVGLPDESRCPDSASDADSDGDGLRDAFDAAPDDPDEFVMDTNRDGRFEICNIHQLQAIKTLGTGEGKATGLSADERNQRDYELVRSIDAAAIENFIPIGDCGPSGNCMIELDKYGFKGSFDGRGHTISNLSISAPELGGVGMFGVISRGKVVRNIELVNARVEGRGGVGTIVGSNFGTVYNCHSTGKVKGVAAAGGLVGANAGNISYSHASVDVEAQFAVGGLVGDQNANIFASYANGEVSGGQGIGGLIGLNTRGRVVSSYATGDVNGAKNVGGLAGVNTDALLANSYATGSVSGSEVNAGGLVGFNSKSRIRNAYATGDVQGNTAVGGITGTNNGIVFQTFATGSVAGSADVGGLVGKNADGVVQASYWDVAGTGQEAASGTAEGDLGGAISSDDKGLRRLDGDDSRWAPSAGPTENPDYWYCDADGSGQVEAGEQVSSNYAWELGTVSDVPAIRCAPGGVARQRG